MIMSVKYILLSILTLALPIMSIAQGDLNDDNSSAPEVNVIANVEAGFLNVLSHKVQFSNDGNYFDYQKDGGQDVLFPIKRFSLEVNKGRNAVVLLYQPLRLETQVLLDNTLRVDGLDFPAASGVKLLYNFPF